MTSLYFYSQNRNKRSVSLDLKAAADVEKLNRLCETADILIQNLRPGVVDEIGIGPEAMLKRHPRLIYCSIWAFGYQGPLRLKPGFDPLLQAYGGMMSVTGRAEDPPTFCGASINDKATGMFCTIGALAALRMRDKTGKGCLVDTSLFDSAVHWVEGQVNNYIADGAVLAAPRHGQPGDRALPDFRHRRRQVALPGAGQRPAVGAGRAGAGPSRLGDRPQIRQERRAREAQGRAVAADRRRDEEPDARRVDRDLREDGRAVRRGQTTSASSPAPNSSPPPNSCRSCRAAAPSVVGLPITFDRVRPRSALPSPALGEHTDEVLNELK